MNDFENLASRRQYSDQRKLLFEKTEDIRKSMAELFNRQAYDFAIDSMLFNQKSRDRQRDFTESVSDFESML
jgi:hypothetical protein